MLFTLLMHWALKSNIKGSYGGIQLTDMIAEGHHSAEFVVFTIQALRLIERTDPRRFDFVQQELRYIANTPLLSGGAYKRATRRCQIDFLRYRCARNQPGYEWYLARYACTIIHEATHGRIFRFGIPYNEKTWQRIERLCYREEERFVKRLHSEEYDYSTLLPEFDPIWWRDFRTQPKLEQMKKLLARHREVEASTKT